MNKMDEGPLKLNIDVDFKFIAVSLILGLLIVFVVCGNCLVIAAVFTSPKLRSVTNLFIVSLATSDLLLGLLVLPSSGTVEILPYWVFGDVWCSMWLAIDVWMCTSQILNLCAISFDRWIAIQYPMKYATLMSPRRGKLLIACCWIIAFIVCFPPLIGWNEKGQSVGDIHNYYLTTQSLRDDYEIDFDYSILPFANTSFESSVQINNDSLSRERAKRNASLPKCGLTSAPGYIVYSALGSFFLPCCVMLFFYFKIYRAAKKFTESLRRGVRQSKGFNHSAKTNGEDNNVIMRVHRGGGALRKCKTLDNRPKSGSWLEDDALQRSQSLRRERAPDRPLSLLFLRGQLDRGYEIKTVSPSASTSSTGSPPCSPKLLHCRKHFSVLDRRAKITKQRLGEKESLRGSREISSLVSETSGSDRNISRSKRITSPKQMIFSFISKHGTHHDKPLVRRHKRETKAAKTVAIIIGAFIFCWAPFFTYYLITGLCKECAGPDEVFKVIFWLGYCNSAVNPCIYALFARDFRHAFKKLIRCKLRSDGCCKNVRLGSYIASLRLRTDSDQERNSN